MLSRDPFLLSTPAGKAMGFDQPRGFYAAPEWRAGSDILEYKYLCDSLLQMQLPLSPCLTGNSDRLSKAPFL